jgi:hypothetical protein
MILQPLVQLLDATFTVDAIVPGDRCEFPFETIFCP